MAKLGYTWYPKDWKTDENVFNLTLELRGFYREFIDFAYENDNNFTIDSRYWCRMLGINKRKFDTLFARLLTTGLIVKNIESFAVPSVEKRIQLIRGGKKGGETSKPNPKPDSKPAPNQIEIETKRESEKESKIKVDDTSDNFYLIEDLFYHYKTKEILVAAVLGNKKLRFKSKEHLLKRLTEFNEELKTQSIFQKQWSDYASHFKNWHKKQKEIEPSSKPNYEKWN